MEYNYNEKRSFESSCSELSCFTSCGRKYPIQASPLERLPLPKFSVKSVDYIRFKLEFHKYVTYKTEAEKVLAIKEQCVAKKDKDRVANKQTIK